MNPGNMHTYTFCSFCRSAVPMKSIKSERMIKKKKSTHQSSLSRTDFYWSPWILWALKTYPNVPYGGSHTWHVCPEKRLQYDHPTVDLVLQNMVLMWKIPDTFLPHVLYEKVYSTVTVCLGCLGALFFNRFPVLPLPDQSVKRKQWLITE